MFRKNYGRVSALLHDVLLGNRYISRGLFEFESLIFLENAKLEDVCLEKHVFICGLPRSGTTAITNFIHSSDQFASLTYRDMPFICSVNLFKFFTKHSQMPKQERFHADGILIDLDSPEALDEFFFQSLANPLDLSEFQAYVFLILKKYKKNRYISKNNANLFRIDNLCEMFPNSKSIVMFRNPKNHVFSLFQQHLRFSDLHQNDKFAKRYMRNIGHFEFGELHKPWHPPKHYFEPLNINYWLEQWLLVYTSLVESCLNKQSCIFISYEGFNEPKKQHALLDTLDIICPTRERFFGINKEVDQEFDETLLDEAVSVYEKLLHVEGLSSC